jgi:hypothetical protein
MAKGYRPDHRPQLGRPVTGSVDCGPRTLQTAIDNATRGARNVGIDRLRTLMGRPGAQPTNVYDADRAFTKLDINYRRVVNGPWSDLYHALRAGHGAQICVSYGVVNDRAPRKSGSPDFRGGHSIYLDEVKRRRKDGKLVMLSFDSLYDGRRAGIPKGPRWVLASVFRGATGAFAGRSGQWWGGIIPVTYRVAGPGDEAEDAPDAVEDWPVESDDEPETGTPLPPASDGEDIDPDDDEDEDDGADLGEPVDDGDEE